MSHRHFTRQDSFENTHHQTYVSISGTGYEVYSEFSVSYSSDLGEQRSSSRPSRHNPFDYLDGERHSSSSHSQEGRSRHNPFDYLDTAPERHVTQSYNNSNNRSARPNPFDYEVGDFDAPQSSSGSSSARDGSPFGHLPKKRLTDADLDSDGKAGCNICMEDLEAGAEVTMLPCTHWFHGECVTHWLKERNTCPLCRTVVDSEGSSVSDRHGDVDPRSSEW